MQAARSWWRAQALTGRGRDQAEARGGRMQGAAGRLRGVGGGARGRRRRRAARTRERGRLRREKARVWLDLMVMVVCTDLKQ